MALSVLNRQRKLRVDTRSLRPLLERCVEASGAGEADVSLVLVSDDAIRRLNREYRGVDRATDCLSFPAQDLLTAEDVPRELGDVMVSVETALRQGREHSAPGASDEEALADEIVQLFVHGLLHLLGHDHLDRGSAEAMQKEHARVLERAGLSPQGGRVPELQW